MAFTRARVSSDTRLLATLFNTSDTVACEMPALLAMSFMVARLLMGPFVRLFRWLFPVRLVGSQTSRPNFTLDNFFQVT